LQICVLWTFYFVSLLAMCYAVSICQCVMRCQKLRCQKTCLCYAIRNEDIAYIKSYNVCQYFCLQFVSFKFHAVPLHDVSSPLLLHAISFTRAFHNYHCYTRIPLHTASVTRAFSVPIKPS